MGNNPPKGRKFLETISSAHIVFGKQREGMSFFFSPLVAFKFPKLKGKGKEREEAFKEALKVIVGDSDAHQN